MAASLAQRARKSYKQAFSFHSISSVRGASLRLPLCCAGHSYLVGEHPPGLDIAFICSKSFDIVCSCARHGATCLLQSQSALLLFFCSRSVRFLPEVLDLQLMTWAEDRRHCSVDHFSTSVRAHFSVKAAQFVSAAVLPCLSLSS